MDVLVAPAQALPQELTERAVRQLDAHLAGSHQLRGEIQARGGVALLRLGDLSVWVHSGRISWSTGHRDERGRPVCASVPTNQIAEAANQIAARYHELCGLAGRYAVRIG